MPAARRVSLRWGAWTRLGGGGVRTFFATARARVPVSLPRRTGWRKSATCAFFRRGRLLTGGARGTYARPVRADEPSGSPALAFFMVVGNQGSPRTPPLARQGCCWLALPARRGLASAREASLAQERSGRFRRVAQAGAPRRPRLRQFALPVRPLRVPYRPA